MGLSNPQYEAIMRVYDSRRLKDKREQDARINKIAEEIPQIAALDDKISALMAEAGRAMLNGDAREAAALKAEAADLRGERARRLEENGYPPDYTRMRYMCPDCRDTGYSEGKKCHCFRDMEIEILYDQSNIRSRLERENFDTLTMDYYDRDTVDKRTGMTVYGYMSAVVRECREFVNDFDAGRGSILFTGNTGSGKTFLSNCIARELIKRYFSVVYMSATDLFELFSRSRFGDRNDDEAKERAANVLDCDMLIIDDLGTELINTFTSSQLFYCVDERLNRRRGTIITTNLPLNRLRDEFTDRVASRIMSSYKVIPLIGEDMRLLMKGYRV